MRDRTFLCATALLLAGCAAPHAPTTTPSAAGASGHAAAKGDSPDSNNDPCAMQLHDMSGAMLLFYSIHQDVPARLEQLKALPSFEKLELSCPASHEPYGYSPKGLKAPGIDGFVFVYDSKPVHPGYRWAIVMKPLQGSDQPYANVIPIPEETFRRATAN